MLAKAARRFDPDECRKYYDKRIEECGDALVVMYACSLGEKAGDDDQKGGYYSYNLLTASKEWAEASTLQAESDILSVVTAHREVERRLEGISGRRQTPHIEKPRTGPYHPFCVAEFFQGM